jgi:putative ABC transport system substrate-binding protein
MKWYAHIIIAGLVLSMLFSAKPAPLQAENGSPQNFDVSVSAVLIISRNIRPYVEAAAGVRNVFDTLSNSDVQIYELDRYNTQKARQSLAVQFNQMDMQTVFIAVGPEAAAFLWKDIEHRHVRKFFSIVLNPEKMQAAVNPACGMALNIPPALQLDLINRSFPEACRIGIFFDPEENSDFFAQSQLAAEKLGITLEPLAVSARGEIPATFKAMIQHVDAIWLIPDPTVISESIAQYLIKQSLLKGVPVIGYNQFFYESGAAAAFVFDYEVLGRQTAYMVLESLKHGDCEKSIPDFRLWVNKAVYEKLGIDLPEIRRPLEIGP